MSGYSNVLIVEDDDAWSAIYRRAAQREGVSAIRVARSLDELPPILLDMAFGAAFIDIGLDVTDDRNVDGLRAMELITACDDSTSMIVITGRSGRDVLPITRDAIKKYKAFDAISKVPAELSELRTLLRGGLTEHQRAVEGHRRRVADVLRGSVPGMSWDSHVLRRLSMTGGVSALYEFLDRLFAEFLPVVGPRPDYAVSISDDSPIVFGDYWSRAVGAAVLICLGRTEDIDSVVRDAAAGATVLDEYRPTEVLRKKSAGSVQGAVFRLAEKRRDQYVVS